MLKTCWHNLWKLPSPMYFRPKLDFVPASCFSDWKLNAPSEMIWPHPLCPPLFDYENDDTPYSVQFVWCPRRLLSLMLESLESCCCCLVWHITYCTGVQKGRRKAYLLISAYLQLDLIWNKQCCVWKTSTYFSLSLHRGWSTSFIDNLPFSRPSLKLM